MEQDVWLMASVPHETRRLLFLEIGGNESQIELT